MTPHTLGTVECEAAGESRPRIFIGFSAVDGYTGIRIEVFINQSYRSYSGGIREMFDYTLLDKIVDRIVSKFSPEKVIIFGSVANGTAGSDSDVDILIIMDTELSYYRRSGPIRAAMRGIPVAADMMVLTPDEYEGLKNDESSFASIISKTGVVAYEA